jgi:hypothetical protein
MAASLFVAPLAAHGQAITLSNQATARGPVYPIQNIPQANGMFGFGVACADLDRDGDDDIVALGRLNG